MFAKSIVSTRISSYGIQKLLTNARRRCSSTKNCVNVGEKFRIPEISSKRGHHNMRNLSTVACVNPTSFTTCLVSDLEMKNFLSVYPEIVRCLTELDWLENHPEIARYYERLLHNILPNKTHGSGHVVPGCYKILADSPKGLTPENIHLANILGWLTELEFSTFLINDDITDASETRNNLPCWYKIEGLRAVFDAQMIENMIHIILKKYFSNYDWYLPAMELFHEITMKAAIGQSMDSGFQINGGNSVLETFTPSKYGLITTFKAATLNQLAVRLAMFLANVTDTRTHEQASVVLSKIGHIWQVDNDVLDCCGDSEAICKIPTDIRNGKCCWPIVKALEVASPAQKETLKKNYGHTGSQCEQNVLQVYKDVKLFDIYLEYKMAFAEEIRKDVEKVGDKRVRKMFGKLLEEPDVGLEMIYMN